LIPALLPDSSEALRRAIEREHGQIFKSRYLHRIEAFLRATELIQALRRRGARVILASSAKPDELAHYVQLLGIAPLLDSEASSKDVAESKPAGDIFAIALSKVAPIPPTETLAVGDTIYSYTWIVNIACARK
jgi:beta-phosphoglucomutase-like phosphatase (HAD superfamily)